MKWIYDAIIQIKSNTPHVVQRGVQLKRLDHVRKKYLEFTDVNFADSFIQRAKNN